MSWYRLATVAALLWMASACKSRAEVARNAERDKGETAKQLMTEAQGLLKEERYGEAAASAQAAGVLLKTDPGPYLLVFEIRRAEGNAPAAALAIQQAAELKPAVQPYLKKQLVEMYRQEGRWVEAVAVLKELADASYLNAAELCTLARLQGRTGDIAGAFATVKHIQEADPGDVEAQATRAEILLASGNELGATQLMDRLLSEHPDLVSARLLRTRYFLQKNEVEAAIKDLARIQGPSAQSLEYILLKTSVFTRRHQLPEAESLLQESLERSPKDVSLLARLAEVKLDLGKTEEGEDLVDAALALRPGSPRARYMQGRVQEMKGRFPEAIHTYQTALEGDPALAPALSHLWPLLKAAGEKTEVMSVLERLVFLNEASIPEKVALAELYLDTNSELVRAFKIMTEVCKRDPDNPNYARLRAELAKRLNKRAPGIVIIRGRKH